MVAVSDEAKSFAKLDPDLLNGPSSKCVEKTMEHILSNLVSKVSNINSSVLWIVLWGIFICFLLPVFCQIVSQISYVF